MKKSAEQILIETEDKWMKENGYPDSKGVKEIAILSMEIYADQVKPKWISCVPEHKLPNGHYAFYLKHTTTGIEGVRLIELKNGENTSEVFHYGTHYCKIELPEKPEL